MKGGDSCLGSDSASSPILTSFQESVWTETGLHSGSGVSDCVLSHDERCRASRDDLTLCQLTVALHCPLSIQDAAGTLLQIRGNSTADVAEPLIQSSFFLLVAECPCGFWSLTESVNLGQKASNAHNL